MKKESCELIRDLLPLYEDGVASEEARKLVQEHLEECPDCRKELDKLRAPVSLPPEPQEDAFWKRFEERRAQHRRAVHRRILCAAVLMAVLIGAALWYTRPMTLDELCPGLNREDITSLSGMCNVYETQPNGRIVSTFHTINLYGDEAAGTIAELFRILDSYTYRRSLTSLLPRPSISTSTARNPYWWEFAMGGGLSFSANSFFPDKLDLTYIYDSHHASFYCRTEDQEALNQAVFELLAPLSTEN